MISQLPNYLVIHLQRIIKDFQNDKEFKLNNRDITLAFRGSSNQRIIDVKASLDSNKVVLLNLEG